MWWTIYVIYQQLIGVVTVTLQPAETPQRVFLTLRFLYKLSKGDKTC